MDTTASTVMRTPATGLASYAVELCAGRTSTALSAVAPGTAVRGSAVQGTGLPFAVRPVAHASEHGAWVAGSGARSTDLLGPVPRGAPV